MLLHTPAAALQQVRFRLKAEEPALANFAGRLLFSSSVRPDEKIQTVATPRSSRA